MTANMPACITARARLRRVVQAKDTEIAVLRAALEAGQARPGGELQGGSHRERPVGDITRREPLSSPLSLNLLLNCLRETLNRHHGHGLASSHAGSGAGKRLIEARTHRPR
jgi:hypothetical protein